MAKFIVIAIAVILVILFLGHWALYWFILSVFPAVYGHLTALRIILGILWISFVLASVISQKSNNIFTRTLYKISAVWLGLFMYLLIGAFLYVLAMAIFPLSSHGIASIIGEILIGSAVIVGVYGIINANRIRITFVNVPMPNLPEVWKSRKAVFISDLHLGQVRGVAFTKRIVSKIGELKPDLIFIGGDLYDGVAMDAEEMIKPFSKLQVPLGIYFITGNHEEFSDNSEYLSVIRDSGIKTLMDEKVIIDGVQLIGVDYARTSKKEVFDKILKDLNINRETPSILLKHVPSDLNVALKNGISLQLSGHTHRAQVFPFNFLTPAIFKGFDYGLHSLESMQVYTSSGVGTWGPPLRVGTKAEIVKIMFQ